MSKVKRSAQAGQIVQTAVALFVCSLAWGAERSLETAFAKQPFPTMPPINVTFSAPIDPIEVVPTPIPTVGSVVPPLQLIADDDPLAWIAFIEARWDNVDIIACEAGEFLANCTQWTGNEVRLLFETLDGYLFSDYFDGEITLARREDADWAGLAAGSVQDGIKKSEIWISDSAWRTPPALGILDIFDTLFRKPDYFQGTIAHELTHAAVWFHPELLDWWINEKGGHGLGIERGNLLIGWMYNWSAYDEYRDDPETYERLIEGELFAMTVASLMYDPWLN
jgi:hypothetical protein